MLKYAGMEVIRFDASAAYFWKSSSENSGSPACLRLV
jgi:hypothetical protein